VGTRTRFGRGSCGPIPSFTCGRGAPPVARLNAGAAAAAPAFSLATGGAPRPQVKEGIGPQLPRPNRVRVPT
ncbi:hypothetical protein RYZ99_24035, partial [Salmonella enterica subsp. enterica serovar Enteritidis]|uniref:hypothetical protein n=1 Tax=Salmonella enterica TaxID=28901 RepID=UPI0029655BCF